MESSHNISNQENSGKSIPTGTRELIIETYASDKAWRGVLLEHFGNT